MTHIAGKVIGTPGPTQQLQSVVCISTTCSDEAQAANVRVAKSAIQTKIHTTSSN